MGVDVTQRNANRKQSIADYEQKKIFLFDNRYEVGDYKNTSVAEITLKTGMLAARSTGTYEKATVIFNPAGLTATQTVILAGLTYTSTGVTTQAQLAAAFANLLAGATTGAGTATGTYSGTLANFTTSGVTSGSTVVFTNIAIGDTTNLAQTGTGAASTITIVAGSTAIANGFIPVTSSNLADVIGVVALDGSVTLAVNSFMTTNIGTKGTVDGNGLVLPSGVTLQTIVGAKTLRDILEGIGLHVDISGTEHTEFDN